MSEHTLVVRRSPAPRHAAPFQLVWRVTPKVGGRLLVIVIGIALLVHARQLAAGGEAGSAHYDVFWLGLICVLVPLWRTAVDDRLSDRGRVWLAAAIGFAAYIPRLVRQSNAPLLNDEFGQFEQARSLQRTGHLWAPNSVVPMARNFPGLHTLTVGLQQLTGLSTYQTAVVLIALFHVMTALGVYHLAWRVTESSEVAIGAVVIYGVSPQFAFFDSMYAYESFAVPLLVWSAFFAVSLVSARGRERTLWSACLILTCLTALITHHLTTYALVALLLSLALLVKLLDRSDNAGATRILLLVSVGLGVAATGWAINADARLGSYILLYPEQGWRGLEVFFGARAGAPASGGGSAQVVHGLFSGSRLPGYERLLAFASAPILLVGYLSSVVRRIRHRTVSAAYALVALIGAAYFVSLPLVVTSGAAGAKRSWAVSFIGLGVVVADGVAPILRARHREGDKRVRALGFNAALIVALCAVLIGSYGSAINDFEVFPGPFVLGTDGRSVTPELVDLAKWFAVHEGQDRYIITDVRTNEAFGAYADTQIPRYPSWEIFFPKGPPSAQYVNLLIETHVQFVVVDTRLATDVWNSGVYFRNQPFPPSIPLPAAAITKFDSLPWLKLVKATPHYRVYQTLGRRQ